MGGILSASCLDRRATPPPEDSPPSTEAGADRTDFRPWEGRCAVVLVFFTRLAIITLSAKNKPRSRNKVAGLYGRAFRAQLEKWPISIRSERRRHHGIGRVTAALKVRFVSPLPARVRARLKIVRASRPSKSVLSPERMSTG